MFSDMLKAWKLWFNLADFPVFPYFSLGKSGWDCLFLGDLACKICLWKPATVNIIWIMMTFKVAQYVAKYFNQTNLCLLNSYKYGQKPLTFPFCISHYKQSMHAIKVRNSLAPVSIFEYLNCSKSKQFPPPLFYIRLLLVLKFHLFLPERLPAPHISVPVIQ